VERRDAGGMKALLYIFVAKNQFPLANGSMLMPSTKSF
jgi:hypothetical protein